MMQSNYFNQKSSKIDEKSKHYTQTESGLQQESNQYKTQSLTYSNKPSKKSFKYFQKNESQNESREGNREKTISPVPPKVEIKRQIQDLKTKEYTKNVSHRFGGRKAEQDYSNISQEDYTVNTTSAFSYIKKQNMLKGVRRTNSTLANYPKASILSNNDIYQLHLNLR